MVNLNLKCTNRVGCLTATQNHRVRYYLNYTSNNQGRGGKILGGVQVICNMPFLMLREGHEMANRSTPGGGGWSEILVGLNTF